MKIIDIGICIDNIDPKGLGRIRTVRYSDYVSQKEKALEYDAWDKNDPFIANPFLPTNINFIPEIGQAVKLINYNPEKSNLNVEYIAGPFTTSFDFNGQTFSQQISETTYGNANKKRDDIIDKNDSYIDKKTEGAFAKKTDFAVYGKYGSDVLFTENGLQLRGGKLISKSATSGAGRKKLVTYPIMGKKSANLYLKKFPKKLTLQEINDEEIISEIKDIKYLIEYEIDSLSGPTKINFFVYKILKNTGNLTKTNSFNENTELPQTVIKLINTDNTSTTPTLVIDIEDVNFISSEINEIFYTLIDKGFNGLIKDFSNLQQQFSEVNLPTLSDDFPLYFRPTKKFVTHTTNTENEKILKNNILSNVRVHNVGPRSGLIWSQTELTPPLRKNKKITKVLKLEENSPEQTFSALKSDKIYFLSTDTNETEKTVSFPELDKYELSQEDYIMKIDPNTYSTVRGENLLRLLLQIIDVLFKHEHNLIGPMVQSSEFSEYVKLIDLLKSVENDLLNKSIRIN